VNRAIVLVLLVAAACSKKSDQRAAPTAGRDAAGAATAPATVDAAPAVRAYVLGSGDTWIKVTLAPPPGWSEENLGSGVYFQGPGMSMSKFDVGVTCHGSCDDLATARKNIAAMAKEEFDFVKGPNHVPPLEPTWAREPTETAPGTWSWRFDAVNPREKQEEHAFRIDRILPSKDPTSTKILTCHANVDEHDPGWADTLEALCRDLAFEVVAKPPAPDAAP